MTEPAEPLRQLWESERVRAARHTLVASHASTLALQVEITEIPAPTGEEGARAERVAQCFRSLSLSGVRTDEAGNVIAVREGAERGGAPVVICAHLDTVFPAGTHVTVRREGSRLLGPGIGDNGRGVAAMLALAAVLDGRTLRTKAPVTFVATAGEEGAGDLRGAKHVFASTAAGARAAIALDGAGDERIVHRALGSRRYRISFHGPGGHSWTAFGVPNAVHAAALATARLSRVPLPITPRSTLSVGRIGGGISINSIPQDAWLEVDVRSTADGTLDALEREIRRIVATATDEENDRRAPETSALVARVECIGCRPGGETPAGHPLVALAVEATRLVGREPELATASTDANVPISRGIPAIAIGAGGRGGEAHTEGEWFDATEGALGVERALGIVLGAAGLAG